MAVKKQKTAHDDWHWLSELNFHPVEDLPGVWKFNAPSDLKKSGWSFRHVSIDTSGAQPSLLDWEVFLPFSSISEMIQGSLDESEKATVICDVIRGPEDEVLVTLNCPLKTKTKSCPQSFVGQKFYFNYNKNLVNVYFYDYFALNFPPTTLQQSLVKAIQGLFFKGKAPKSNICKSSDKAAPFFAEIFSAQFVKPEADEAFADLGAALFSSSLENIQSSVSDEGILFSFVFQHETNVRRKDMGMPVGVLEAEELLGEYRDVIDALSSGEIKEAWKDFQEIPSKDCPKFCLDLLASIAMQGQHRDEIYNYMRAASYQDSLSAWAFVVNYLVNNNDHEKALAEVSQLAGVILKMAPESLTSHGFVLAEILGDLWAHKDPTIAHRFYRSLLKRYGDVPRILNKVIAISSEAVTAEEEISLLKKSLKLEGESQDHLARISSLYNEEGKLDEAIHYGMKALQSGYVTGPLVLSLTELHIKQNLPRQALQLLDDYCGGDHDFSKEDLARMHMVAGDLWMEQLNRPKLAQRRYTLALEACETFVPVYERLEKFYESSANWEVLAAVLAKKLAILPTNDASATAIFNRICEVERQYSVGVNEKWRSLKTIIERGFISDTEIELFVTEDVNSQADWRAIADHLALQLADHAGEFEDEPRAERLTLIARICHDRLGEETEAAAFLQKANKVARINTQAFNRLQHKAKENALEIDPGEVLNDRLKHLDQDDQKEMLGEMVSVSKDMSLTDLRALALQQYLSNNGQSDLFFEAFQRTLDANDGEKIKAFVLSCLRDFESNVHKKHFTIMAMSYFSAQANAPVSACMTYLLEQFRGLAATTEEYFTTMAHHIGKSTDAAYSSLVKDAMAQGYMAEFDEQAVTAVLASEPEVLARHYLKDAEAAVDITLKIELSTKARKIALNDQQRCAAELADCFAMRGTMMALERDELASYRSWAESAGEWSGYVACLEYQAQQVQNVEKKLAMYLDLFEIFAGELKNSERALSCLETICKLQPDNLVTLVQLAEMQKKLKLVDAEKQTLQIIFDKVSPADGEVFADIINRFKDLYTAEQLEQLAIERVQSLITGGGADTAYKFLEKLAELGIRSYELTILAAGISTNREECLTQLMKATGYILDISAWYDHASASEALCKKFSISTEDFYREITEQEMNEIAPVVLQEVYVYLGNAMFALGDDNSRAEAYEFYSQVYNIDPSDLRIWIPYYELIKERDEINELKDYLTFLIPELEANQDLLDGHSVTLEDMQTELERIRKGLYRSKKLEKEDNEVSGEASGNFSEESTFLNKVNAKSDVPELKPRAPDRPQFAEYNSEQEDTRQLLKVEDPADEFIVPQNIELDVDTPQMDSYSSSLDNASDSSENSSNQTVEEEFALDFGGLNELQVPTDANDATAVLPSNPSALNSPDDEGVELDFGVPDPETKAESLDNVIEGNFGASTGMRALIRPKSVIDESEPVEGPPVELSTDESMPLDFEMDLGSQENFEPAAELPAEESGPIEEEQANVDFDPAAVDWNMPSEEESTEDVASLGEYEALPSEEEPVPEEAVEEEPIADEEPPVEMDEYANVEPMAEIDGMDFQMEMAPPEEELAAEEATSEPVGPMVQIDDIIYSKENDESKDAASYDAETRRLDPMELPALAENNSQLSGRLYNWRELIEAQSADPGSVQILIRTPFESELEKHIAIQAVGVLTGDLTPLDDWHMKVWKDISTWNYSTDARTRIDEEMVTDTLYNDFFRFLVYLTPVLVQLYDNRFTFDGYVRQLGGDPRRLEKLCEPRSWDQGSLADVGLSKYGPRFEKTQYQSFHLPGLGSNIFYDGNRRGVFYDETYYKDKPPSFLLFGILNEIWGVRLGYHVCLNLRAREEIFPVLQSILAFHNMSTVQRMKFKVTQRNNPLFQFLSQIPPQKLTAYAQTIAHTEARDVAKMQFSMRDHLLKILLSESLNLVGLLEYMTQTDLGGRYKTFNYMDIVRTNPHVESLVTFVTKLKL